MIEYPFQFVFDGQDYVAKFIKIGASLTHPPQFNVYNLRPHPADVPDIFILTWNPNNQILEFGHTGFFNFGMAVLNAVVKECHRVGVSIP